MSKAEDFAIALAATFGEKPRWHGREKRVRCPVHEAEGVHSPSLAIWDNGGSVAFRCLTGCPKSLVASAIRALGVPCGEKEAVSQEAAFAARQNKEQRRVESLTKARETLGKAHPITSVDPAGIYLEARKLMPLPDGFVPLASKDPVHPGGHALLGVITDLTTLRKPAPKCTGIQTLSLMPDGSPRLDSRGKKFRSIIGTQTGYAVALGAPAHDLVVGEGMETVMAAMQLLHVKFGAAVLSASNMTPLAVPEWVGRVVIAADNDDPGLAAAKSLRLSLVLADVAVEIKTWGETGSGWDAADQLLKEKNGAG